MPLPAEPPFSCYVAQLPCGAAVACSCRVALLWPPLPHVATLRLPSPVTGFARPPSPCSCRPPRVSHPCALALCTVSRPGMVVRDVVARLALSVAGPVCLVCMCMVACGPARTTCTSTRPRPGKVRPVKCVRMSATPHDPTQNVSVDITPPPQTVLSVQRRDGSAFCLQPYLRVVPRSSKQ